jgi:hypothetical protein
MIPLRSALAMLAATTGLAAAVALGVAVEHAEAARLAAHLGEVLWVKGKRADAQLMMPTSRKGHGQKNITHRPVLIPTSLVARLPVMTDKPGTDTLLVKPSGEEV